MCKTVDYLSCTSSPDQPLTVSIEICGSEKASYCSSDTLSSKMLCHGLVEEGEVEIEAQRRVPRKSGMESANKGQKLKHRPATLTKA